MKAKQINGQIVQYKRLPSTYTKSDGSVILNFRKADTATLEAEGFYDVVSDSYDPRVEVLGEITWDADNSVFKRTKSNKTIQGTLSELKAEKIAKVKELANVELSKTDWYITREAELGTATPSAITTERSDIRAKVEERETEVNALTTKKNVAKWTPILFDPPAIDLP